MPYLPPPDPASFAPLASALALPNAAALEAEFARHLTTANHNIEIHGPYAFALPVFSRVAGHPRERRDLRDIEAVSLQAADQAVEYRKMSTVSGSGSGELDAFEALHHVVRVLLWPLLRSREAAGLDGESWGWAVWGVSGGYFGPNQEWVAKRRARLKEMLESPTRVSGSFHVLGTVLVERMIQHQDSVRTWHLVSVLCSLLASLGREVVVGEVDWAAAAAEMRLPGCEEEDEEEELEMRGRKQERGEERGGPWAPLEAYMFG
ncbi:uncharacterized protein BDZ99DRAFT_568959 [Mytilinidion resinicola]|uniref:Uncharacterized protein n=1 Tax=Mytilinidion resinicola TaxID=574789 RepID=A0A6A6YTH7_9PEZI|nr:uncharacterized protein BDZ99DRAFT_568959 [Mytilinidion resinicola]KAF2812256.1 hypothetical protein BDZ99DRAFT_568959 [Mytilinidion resinicola]